MQGHRVLIVYKETVPRSKSYRAAIKDKENIQLCVARPFDDIDEALRIYNILISLKHPNLLCPLGLWKCCGDGLSLEDKAKAGKGENDDVKAEEPKKEVIAHEVKTKQEVIAHEVKTKQEVIAHEVKPKQEVIAHEVKPKEEVIAATKPIKEEVIAEKVKVKAFITFPAFDGALVDLPREEIFLVEDNNSPQADAYGFTRLGSKLFCDILDVVKYINGQYGNENAEGSLSLSPIKINSGRIVYKKVAEGEYHIYIWADFFIDLPISKRKKTSSGKHKDPTAGEIQSANWDSVGTYLKNLWQGSKVTPNKELKQLASVLTNTKSTLLYTDLMWEPGLWSVDIKIHFIREVYWCTDNETGRMTWAVTRRKLK